MFGDLGILEVMLLLVLGVIVFGGDIPEVGRKIGQMWGKMRRMLFEVRNQLENEARMVEGELEEAREKSKLEMDEMHMPTEELEELEEMEEELIEDLEEEDMDEETGEMESEKDQERETGETEGETVGGRSDGSEENTDTSSNDTGEKDKSSSSTSVDTSTE